MGVAVGSLPDPEPKAFDDLHRIAGSVRTALRRIQRGQMLPDARLVDKSLRPDRAPLSALILKAGSAAGVLFGSWFHAD